MCILCSFRGSDYGMPLSPGEHYHSVFDIIHSDDEFDDSRYTITSAITNEIALYHSTLRMQRKALRNHYYYVVSYLIRNNIRDTQITAAQEFVNKVFVFVESFVKIPRVSPLKREYDWDLEDAYKILHKIQHQFKIPTFRG